MQFHPKYLDRLLFLNNRILSLYIAAIFFKKIIIDYEIVNQGK